MSAPEIVEAWPSESSFAKDSADRKRTWTVVARSQDDALRKLRDQRGVRMWTPYQNHLGEIPNVSVQLSSYSVKGNPEAPVGGTGLYEIVGNYTFENRAYPGGPGGGWVWTPRPTLSSTPVDLDAVGKPIVTISEEPIDPPLTALRPGEIIHGERYFQGDDAIKVYAPLRQYNGTLNASTCFGAPRGCIFCHVFTPGVPQDGWVLVSVDFEYKKPWTSERGVKFEGWQDVFPQKGTRKVIDSSATDSLRRYRKLQIGDANGNAVSADHPMYLDTDGNLLASTDKAVLKAAQNYLYKEFKNIPGMASV